MRAVELDALEAEPCGATKPALTRSMSAVESAIGSSSPSAWGTAEGASVFQPSGSPGAICAPPSHGAWLDALRPAWPTCIVTAMSE